MAALYHSSFSLFLLTVAFSFLSASSSSPSPSPLSSLYGGRFSKIYAFGDSFTDTGNTDSTAGASAYVHVSNPPYGSTFFGHPTNRYSDGRLVVDFLSESLSLPFLPPYRVSGADFSHGVNFAVGGSTAVEHDFFVKNNISLDLTKESIGTQLGWFDRFLVERGGESAVGEALFWVGEIGANDHAYIIGSSVSDQTVRHLAVNRSASFLQALLERGARYVVVQGLPMTGCLPLALYLAAADDRDDLGCVASSNNDTRIHNAQLQYEIRRLRNLYPTAFIAYADYFNAHHDVMQDPAKYGFSEPFLTCCGSGGGAYNFDFFNTCGSPSASKACSEPSKFVNWDGIHLTEALYEIVAEKFLRGGYIVPSFGRLVRRKRRGGG